MLKPRNLLIFACLLVPLSVTGGEARVDIDAILGDTIDAAIDGNPAGAAAATPGETADEIVSLMSRTLARYSTPPHSCETPRQVENQVQILGECRLGFRSRSEHDYLCGGGSRRVLSSRRADVDFSKDIAAIADGAVVGSAIFILLPSSASRSATLSAILRSAKTRCTDTQTWPAW